MSYKSVPQLKKDKLIQTHLIYPTANSKILILNRTEFVEKMCAIVYCNTNDNTQLGACTVIHKSANVVCNNPATLTQDDAHGALSLCVSARHEGTYCVVDNSQASHLIQFLYRHTQTKTDME
jgi:hypothetical protein